jgi:D-alanyl-D-alanine carboxypeptidase (penicillin-binding protein 5/6)
VARQRYERPAARRARIRRRRIALAVAAAAVIAGGLANRALASSPTAAPAPPRLVDLRSAPPIALWPEYGQAAYVRSGEPGVHASPAQRAVPIASVAKVMTAYLVLRDHPLRPGEQGPTITLGDDDAEDTDRRRRQGESIVPVEAGERLTERQALQALLIPSANNVAAVLARWDAGSQQRFVARMNAAARSLGMTQTRYTDPSGYDDATVSTAADQLRVVLRAMRMPVFAEIVGTPSVELPVAGTVENTDGLLGHGGFVGVKTGSDSAAGGCFAFRAIRPIEGSDATITGVVLGQPGHDLIAAGLQAAAVLVDRIAGP